MIFNSFVKITDWSPSTKNSKTNTNFKSTYMMEHVDRIIYYIIPPKQQTCKFQVYLTLPYLLTIIFSATKQSKKIKK
jgi:hypothetical protein